MKKAGSTKRKSKQRTDVRRYPTALPGLGSVSDRPFPAENGADHEDGVLEKPPLRQQVYDRLEQMIMRGALQPSERLIETDLAKLLKVSRGPIREALQWLERDGWVEMRPRLGAVVRRRSAREISEQFEVRRTLESRGIELAAMRITDEEKNTLRGMMDVAEKALADGDINRLIEANSIVHNYLPLLSGNETMANLVRSISRRIRWYMHAPQILTRAPEVLAEHRDIVKALMAGDSAAASAAMHRHNEAVWRTYVEWLKLPRF